MSTSVHKQAADTAADPSTTPTPAATGGAGNGAASHLTPENNGISSSSNGRKSDISSDVGTRSGTISKSTAVADSSGVSSSSCGSGGGSVSGSGGGGGGGGGGSHVMSASSNPFARSVGPPQVWGSSESTTSDYTRPILAPSKLGAFGGCVGASTSSTVLKTSVLGKSSAAVASSTILAPSRLFDGGSSTVSTTPVVAETTRFKLKPSILSSAVNSNPFLKARTGDLEESDSKNNEANSTKDEKQENENVSTLRESRCEKQNANDGVGSSSEANIPGKSDKDVSSRLDASCATTPPPSPPHSTLRKDGGNSCSKSFSEYNSSTISSSILTSTSSAAPISSSSTEAAAVTTTRSIFGMFAAKVEDKTPAACSSPKPPPSLSTNGVKSSLPGARAGSFIFGQNLHSRALPGDGSDASSSTNGESSSSAAAGVPSAAATTADNLFSVAAAANCSRLGGPGGGGLGADHDALNSGKSLAASSRELAEKESREKRKFEEVEVITGEETESNVLQMNCKLYHFVKGVWQERGRGILRLNDWGSGGTEMHSRLVVRMGGTLTIMLNTKIWSEMSLERASSKSIRFTASDVEGQLKIYLVMGLPKDIELLFTSLEWRVSNSRHRELGGGSGDSDGANKKPRKEDQPSSSTNSSPLTGM